MLQALMKLGWICSLLALMPANALPETRAPAKTIPVTVSVEGEGSVIVSDQNHTWQADQNQPLSFELEQPGTLHMEAAAAQGWRVEQIVQNETKLPEKEAEDVWADSLSIEEKTDLAVRFSAVQEEQDPVESQMEEETLQQAEEADENPVRYWQKSGNWPELYAALDLDPDTIWQILQDYAAGKTDEWTELRMQAAQQLNALDCVDENGFILPSYFEDHSLEAFEAAGGNLINPMWIHAPDPGVESAPWQAQGKLRARSLNLTIASRVMYSNVVMPGGNMISNGLWTLSNGEQAFCANYLMATPKPGQALDDPIEQDSAALRKALYYGYLGPGNVLPSRGFSTKAQQIMATNDLVSMAFCGGCIAKNEAGGVNWTACMAALWNYVQSLPDPAGYAVYVANVQGTGINHHGQTTGMQPMAYGKAIEKGYLQIHKSSAVPGITQAAPKNYSLENARYALRKGSSFENGKPCGELTIRADGTSEVRELDCGLYWLQEITAPEGYVLDTAPVSITVSAGSSLSAPVICRIAEQPQYAKPEVLLQKINTRTGKGEVAMAGARFRMNYYSLRPDALDQTEKSSPARSWIMQTDNKGQIRLGDSYRLEGPDFYRNEKNEPVFPLGIVTFQEIAAPEGYSINTELFKVSVKASADPSAQLGIYQTPECPEYPAGIILMKMDSGYKYPLEGARFKVTDPHGTGHYHTTNAQGKITLDLNMLGEWTIEEIEAPFGYQLNSKKAVLNVQADRIISSLPGAGSSVTFTNHVLLFLDDPVPSLLRIRKVDTGSHVLKGAQFTLYGDPEGKRVLAAQESDSSGWLEFSGIIDGDYYLAETRAPEGFDLPVDKNGKPVMRKLEVRMQQDSGRYRYVFDGEEVTSTFNSRNCRVIYENRVQILEMWITNAKGAILPETGSSLMPWLLAGGTITAGCGVAGLARPDQKRKRKKK